MRTQFSQQRCHSGFMMLDALIGTVVFGLFIVAVGSSLLFSQRGFLASGDHMRGAFLAERSLEALRTMRDDDFSLLTAGTHGVRIGSGNKWELTSSGTTTADGYTSTVTITVPSSDTVQAAARTSWNHGLGRSGSVVLTTQVTNWRIEQPIGNWASVSQQGAYTDIGVLFNKVAVSGNYAFVTTGASPGLYVFDVSNLASPTRVASAFTLGEQGHDLLIVGDVLYIITGHASAELRSYDISTPTSLAVSDLIDEVDMNGDSRARSLGYFNGSLFVGAREDGVEHELYSYTASGGNFTLLDSYDNAGGFMDLKIHQAYAYSGNTQDVSELRVMDIFDPANLVDAPGVGYNVTDIYDGNAIETYGTAAFLGRLDGSSIEEFVMFDIADSVVPSPPPGPWYYEVGGNAEDIVVEPGGRYVFLASGHPAKELQVIDPNLLSGGKPAELDYYDSPNGAAKGVFYDMLKDRVFLATNDAFEIIQPGP